MEIQMIPTFTLTISGNKFDIYHTFEKIVPEKLGEDFRDDFLNNNYVPDDEDPSEAEGWIDIKTMLELEKVIRAFTGKKIRLALWVSIGGTTQGAKIGLEDKQEYGGAWWRCDTDVLLGESKKAIAAAVEGLQKFL